MGLKTTKDRWSTDGITILSTSFDTPGILAKSMTDIAFGFSAIDPAARAAGLPMIAPRDVTGLKIGITRDYFWDYCQDDVGAVVENAIDELVTAGAAALELPLPEAAASIQVWGEEPSWRQRGMPFCSPNCRRGSIA